MPPSESGKGMVAAEAREVGLILSQKAMASFVPFRMAIPLPNKVHGFENTNVFDTTSRKG